MKAMVLHSPADISTGPLRAEDVPDPVPGPGELLVRVSTCGVCHTDLHIVEGELTPPGLPRIPGHQVVGRVAQIAEGVTGWKVGDRVGIPWLHSACGTCTYCRSGRENLCTEARFTGLHVDGGYAEYVSVPADFACRVPDVFDDDHAAPLLCAGIIGYRSLRLSEYVPGGTLALFGFGASAHITLQIAVSQGARVAVYSRSADHRRLAERLGAEWTGVTGSRPPFAVDSAITFAPVGRIVHAALDVVARGGTVAVNAVHMSPIPELEYAQIYHERTVRSVANATREDARRFFEDAAAAGVRSHTRAFDLSEANTALDLLKGSRINGAAVLHINPR